MNTLNNKLRELDEAFNAEISCIGQLEYNSNEICRHFYAKLRERFASLVLSAAQEEREPYLWVRRGARTALHNISFDKPEAGPWDALYLAPPSSDQVWNEAVEASAKLCAQRKLFELADAIRSLKRPLQAQEPEPLQHAPIDPLYQPVSGGDGLSASGAVDSQPDGMACPTIKYEEDANGIRRAILPEPQATPLWDRQPSPVTDELPPLPAPMGTMELNWGTPYAKDIDAYDETQMRGYAISALSRAQAAQQAQAVSIMPWYERKASDRATLHPATVHMQAEIDELRALLSQSAAPVSEQPAAQTAGVPEGWKLVPVHPTSAMGHAGEDALEETDSALAIYDAMLAAARQPVAGQVEGVQAQALRALELIADGEGDAQVIAKESLDLIAGVQQGWTRQKPVERGWYETKRDQDGVEIRLWWDGNAWKASPNSPRHSYLHEHRSHRAITAHPQASQAKGGSDE